MRNVFKKISYTKCMSITFSSCFYVIESKFPPEKYVEWMNNIIYIANNFNLVVYTDENALKYIDTKNKPNIKIIIKSVNEFYNYKYKEYWMKNHDNNNLLNNKSCWELNMLWSEKISFVKETINKKYFDTDFYGWCDIGYFRNRKGEYNDTNTSELTNWPDMKKINNLDKNKIVYGCINNNEIELNQLIEIINIKNAYNIPINQIPPNQTSIAGGFFILHKGMIDWWFEVFDKKLLSYFNNNYLVKDDQIIIADCVFTNKDNFLLFKEKTNTYDNWFMFQRIFN